MMQGNGISGSSTVPQGGTIVVHVTTGDATVSVSTGGIGDAKSFPVAADGTATIPVPTLPGGTLVCVSVGAGLKKKYLLVEVVAPAP